MNYIFSDRISALQPSAIREILKATSDPAIIPFAAGNPAPEAFPVEFVQRTAADLLRETPIAALQYSVTEGLPALREALASMLHGRYQIGGEGDGVLVVSGAQQGIDLAVRCLVNEGDTVLAEDPSFIGSLNCFRSYRAKLTGIPMEPDGLDVDYLEHVLKQDSRVRILYLIPNFQNPTGATMSLAKRKAVYELARRYGFLILEDNPYGDLWFEGEPLPSLKSMDTEGIVLYVGSFSKVLSPGLRVGYVCAPQPILQKMTVAKQCNDVHTPVLNQMICHQFVTAYDLDAHFHRLREIYRNKCRLMLEGLSAHWNPAVTYQKPRGGLFLWCTLPEGADMLGFCRRAVERKVAVVPGSAFSTDENSPSRSIRLNYSTPTDERIVEGMEILGQLTQEL